MDINGAFHFFEQNDTSHTYKFISLVNTTYQDSVITYPQLMYESILRKAAGDSQLEFRVRSTSIVVEEEVGWG